MKKVWIIKNQKFTRSPSKKREITIPPHVSVEKAVSIYKQGFGHGITKAISWAERKLTPEQFICLRDYLLDEANKDRDIHFLSPETYRTQSPQPAHPRIGRVRPSRQIVAKMRDYKPEQEND